MKVWIKLLKVRIPIPQGTAQSSSQLATPSTFSFTPLTKPVDEGAKKEERVKDEEKAGKLPN